VVLGKVERKSYRQAVADGRARAFFRSAAVRLGLGAVIGSGKQPLPWIHIDDMVGILLHVRIGRQRAADTTRCRRGRYQPEFIEAFAARLRRPIMWSAPSGWSALGRR
jgi:NAD dependent epimerase/dehydratase family enzyme